MNRYVSRIPNIFCMKSWIEGHARAVLGSIADLARFDPCQTKLAMLPSTALPRPSIQDFMQNMIGNLETYPLTHGDLIHMEGTAHIDHSRFETTEAINFKILSVMHM